MSEQLPNRDTGSHTDYGFTWGPMEVYRTAWVPGKGRSLTIRTDHASIQVAVSEKGRKIRVFGDMASFEGNV